MSSSIQQLYHRAWIVPIIVGSSALAALLIGAYHAAVSPLSTMIERIVQQCVAGVRTVLTPMTAGQIGLGILAFAVALTFVASLLVQIMRTRRIRTSLNQLQRDRTERFVELASHTPLCFTVGLFHPQIFVSSGARERLSQEELESVLVHEEYHARHRDPLKLMILRAFAHAFFFLPIFKAFAERLKTTNEIAADAAALPLPGGRAALATALYKLTRGILVETRMPLVPSASVASFAASGTIDLRLEFMGGRAVHLPIAISKCVVSLFIFFILLIPTVSVSHAETVAPCAEHSQFVHPKRDTPTFEYVLPTPVPWKLQ